MNGIESGTKEVIVPLTSGRRVSWGAIWAGMFVTVVMEIMFILLGVICGIKTLNPGASLASVGEGMSLGAMIWLMCSWLVAVWVGARVAGWMSGGPSRRDGLMHGLVVWSFSAMVILLFVTGAIGAFGGGGGGNSPTAGTGDGMSYNSGGGPGQQQQASGANPGGNAGGSEMGGTGGNAGISGGGGGNVTNQPNWGRALWTFVALVLGLGVACAGGAMGASAALDEDRIITPVT